MQRSHTTITAFMSSLFLCGSVCICLFLFYKVDQKKDELLDLQMEKAQALFNAHALTALSTSLSSTQSERTYITSRILKEEEVVDFLSQIEELGKEQGVSLSTNSLTVLPINSSFEALVVGVSVEGQYSQLMHFLTLLENLPYQVRLRKVVFERLQGEGMTQWKSAYDIVVTKIKKQ